MASSLQFQCQTSMITRRKCLGRCPIHLNSIVSGRSASSLEKGELAFPKLQVPSKPYNGWSSGAKARNACCRIHCIDDSRALVPQHPQNFSALEMMIKDLYDLINQKKIKELLELISNDCTYEDLVFYSTFEGKEQIGHFIEILMDAMGHNVKFHVEIVTAGKSSSTAATASVIWHLEWREKMIPFTTGYNYFEFDDDDHKLSIRKIRGIEELPVKPGDLILKLLKVTTTIFDHYPIATEGLLITRHDAHEMLSAIYHLITGLNGP